MSGIINWLRGDDQIAILTLLQVELVDGGWPKAFANRPKMAQWVIGHDNDKILSTIQQLVGTIVSEFEEDSDFDIKVEQNDKLRDKTPDCSLVVDISDEDTGVLFRVYLTGFVKSGNGGWK